MKKDLSIILKNRKGKEAYLHESEKEPMTLKEAILASLDFMGSEKMDISLKSSRGKLIRKIMASDEKEIEFKSDELAQMKKAVGEYPWLPFIHETICELIDSDLKSE